MPRFLAPILAASTLLLAACSVQPLYLSESRFGGVQMELRYAEPNTRLEQVAYQTISQRIDQTSSSAFPELTLTVSTRARALGRTAVAIGGERREDPREVTARIVAVVRDASGTSLFEDTREMSSSYISTGQYLADDVAAQGAAETATRAAADAVRLQLLAWGYYYDSDRIADEL